MPKTILRFPGVKAKSGVSRSTHYNQIKDGLMTRPVALGPRARGWPENEIDALNAARIAAKSDDEIRVLVKQLEAARKAAPCLVAEMCNVAEEPESINKKTA
ncbi:AlpA family phage regulatory protein [Noviherbaspirillum cavernae]|uniref:AlpA family phage regulatory protein n=1 Tax=Noviherbaspirillum cavernae TaxID=2320862 RepID=A0A418X0K1_9BURK|nr:AlpA family phage regulatory protein [Noviherbaspirillum cavernae]RJG05845.1 AlpA family phage regulatory protein [Noviherbaspirillum cavernae]